MYQCLQTSQVTSAEAELCIKSMNLATPSPLIKGETSAKAGTGFKASPIGEIFGETPHTLDGSGWQPSFEDHSNDVDEKWADFS